MKSKIIIILLGIFSAGFLYSQPNELKFENISIEHGLSQSTVHSILQDRQGYIWIATEDGLNRYDGYSFNVYRNIRGDTISISSNYVRSIFQDNSGKLWVGTKDGLSVLTLITDPKTDLKKEGFINYLSIEKDSLSLSSNDIRCFYEDRFGNLWIGTSRGLNRVVFDQEASSEQDRLKKIRFQQAFYGSEFTKLTSEAFISSITEDRDGNLWIGTMGNGLIYFDRVAGRVLNHKSNSADPSSIGSNYIIRLFTDHAGIIWIGTYNGGLNKFDYDSGKFVRYKHDPHNNKSISDNKIYGITDDANGNLWIGTFGSGVSYFNLNSNLFKRYQNNPQNPFSLSNDFVRCMLIDRSGNLWVGTNNGLSKADLKAPKFEVFRNELWDPQSISDDFILSVLEDHRGSLWVGTNKGLDKYIPETNGFVHFNVPHNNPKSKEGFVYSLIKDEDSFLWLGTFGGGLIKCNQSGKIISQFLQTENDQTGILDNRVHTLFLMKNGDIAVGTVAGLCVLQKSTNRFRYHLFSVEDSVLMKNKSITQIYKDRSNIFWVGTTEGLFRINPSDGNSKVFLKSDDQKESLSSNSINSICEDLKGNLWIGTDEGLNLLDRKTNSFTVYTSENGLPNNYIANILVDNDGNLWVSTNRGVSRFNPDLPPGNQFRNYDTNDGLQGLEFTPGAAFKNKNGEIYFGGTNGLNKFNPAEIQDNPVLADVAITAFNKFGRPELSYYQLLNSKSIELSYSEDFFSFEFTAFDYTNSAKNQYAYILEGFDKDWNYNGNRRFASYTNIDPGEYTFRVKATNSDGIWNEKPASIKLLINPPFYRTWLAYSFYAILIAVLLYSVRTFELRKQRVKQESLLKTEREKAELRETQLRAERAELQNKALEVERELDKQKIRHRIASDLHDEIGSNLSSISLISSQLKESKTLNENIEEQLSDINLAARISAESIRDIVWFIDPTSDKLGNLIMRMKDTANSMLKNIEFKFSPSAINPDQKLHPDLKRNIYMIFKETLNNITKHSKAGNVKISFDFEDGNMNLLIRDDGVGFDYDQAPKGNGLRNLKRRSDEINGKLVINSLPGKGTSINFSVVIT